MIHRNNRLLEDGTKAPSLIKIKPLSIALFVHMIETQPGFAFARYGDGSFYCLEGRRGENCDGAAYSPEAAAALLASILDPNIIHGIGTLARRVTSAERWLISRGIDIEWYDCDVMNTASEEGKLLPFIQALRKRRTIVVGPSHLAKLGGFPIVSFIECHPTQAFEERDELELEVLYRLEREQADTVLLSAGTFASPTLVSRLRSQDDKKIFIDTGSLFDPYVHVFSRSGHKRTGWDGYRRLGWQNFEEDITKW